MEIHHHPHTSDPDMHRGRKKWNHYLWEFLMLFLAVFAGFLAENWREHIVEHKREKQYIRSMIADLKEDTTNITSVIDYNIKKFHGMDTLSVLLGNNNFSDSAQLRLFKLNMAYASNMWAVLINDRTVRQLLNSGNMRLIHEQKISDSIMQYYGEAKDDLTSQGSLYEETMKRVLFFAEDIFDNTYAKMKLNKDSSFSWDRQWDKLKLLTRDNVILKKYARIIITAQDIVAYYISFLRDMRKRATGLIIFLNKEYHLQ